MTLLSPISELGVGWSCFHVAMITSPPKISRLRVQRLECIDRVAAFADETVRSHGYETADRRLDLRIGEKFTVHRRQRQHCANHKQAARLVMTIDAIDLSADRVLVSPLSFVPFEAAVQSLRLSSFTAAVPTVSLLKLARRPPTHSG